MKSGTWKGSTGAEINGHVNPDGIHFEEIKGQINSILESIECYIWLHHVSFYLSQNVYDFFIYLAIDTLK